MLKQIFVITAFVLVLGAVAVSVTAVERTAARHMGRAEKIIEDKNEAY